MKSLFLKYILLLVLVFAVKATFGQQIIVKNETISTEADSVTTLILPEYRGVLQWQVSYDKQEWITFPNETKDSLLVDLDMDAWYRAVIIDGTCDTVYSDTAKVIISDSLRNYYQNIVLPIAYPDEPGEMVEVFFNNDTITCRKVNDEYVFHGDMILTEKQVKQLNDSKGASIPTDDMFLKLWPEATVYYTICQDLKEDKRIKDAINYWERKTPIRFKDIEKEIENKENYVEFKLVDEGCSSNVGMIGGPQKINISKEKYDSGNYKYKSFDVSHEIGHTIGLFHEHSRWDRDKFIVVHDDRINEDWKWDYRKVSNSIEFGEFDFESIMLYPPCNKTASSGDNYILMTIVDPSNGTDTKLPWKPEYEKNENLSKRDIEFVKWLYATKPFVKTAGITTYNQNIAVCRGNVVSDGGSEIKERGICWDNVGNPSIKTNKIIVAGELGQFDAYITDLQPNIRYYIKAYAINKKGVNYGDIEYISTIGLGTPPTIKTLPISVGYYLSELAEYDSVKTYSAGEIINEGGFSVDKIGVCWNLEGEPNTADNFLLSSSVGLGKYKIKIADYVNYDTQYYLRASGRNIKGTAYGEEVSFKIVNISSKLPGISTNNSSEVSPTTAVVGGTITRQTELEIVSYGICWNTKGNSTIYDNIQNNEDGLTNYSLKILGLSNNTTYYYRAFAKLRYNDDDFYYVYGIQKEFTTKPLSIPTVTTTNITAITQTTANGGGNVTADGGARVTARGVCWNTTGNPTTANSKTTNGTGTGSFTGNLTGLNANTPYYVMAYATNSQGTAYGNEVTFTTGQAITQPTVTTSAITEITQTSATGGGNVTADGGATVTTRGVCWNTSANPTTDNSKTTNGTGTGSFTSNLTGLSANTPYYVRAYVSNSQGTAYGNEVTFTTGQAITQPTVTTSAITEITQTTATGGGNITSDGGATITVRGVCWSTAPNPTIDNIKTTNGTGTGSFTSNLTGLTANTPYYVRAYATNSQGIAYGNEVTFTSTAAEGPVYGTFTDSRDGHIYKTIKIGDQVWMAENLAYLPAVSPSSAGSITEPHYYVYGYEGTSVATAKEQANYTTYGVLYNWPAAIVACPPGWHLPTDAEWTELENYLIANGYNYDGTTTENKIAKSIAATTNWIASPNTGTIGNNLSSNNKSGFSALPGGYRYFDNGPFRNVGNIGEWWSSSVYNSPLVWARILRYNVAYVYRVNSDKAEGANIRCVRD